MSLPAGLIFFLDFKYTDSKGFAGAVAGQSVYGGGRLASEITGGVLLDALNAERSFYALNNGYSSATGSTTTLSITPVLNATLISTLTDAQKALVKWDVDVLGASTSYVAIARTTGTLAQESTTGVLAGFDTMNLIALAANSGSLVSGSTNYQVRRLSNVDSSGYLNLVWVGDSSLAVTSSTVTASFSKRDSFTNGGAIGSILEGLFLEGAGANNSSTSGLSFTDTGLAGQNVSIPEIDIKVDSIAVTAETKKLKAKWTPEIGQDLNAYHNLDAEVELTSLLSEHVALEIDQEILNDLIKGATASLKFWSRRPGKFVNRDTGVAITSVGAPPDFTGNVSMWYETLVETINDVSAQIHRKTLRGGANFLVTSPEVANILEMTNGFRADISAEELKGNSVGAVKSGSISKKWDVYVDPYFPRNLILVGRRGKAFLESGYVYAPYVPLMITPTIFGTEDFVPRKGLMTRYAKKMVRPDYFGIVLVQDMIG